MLRFPPRSGRCQRLTIQTLATARAMGDALPVSLAAVFIVGEHPLVPVLVRLPPEFGPDPVLALAVKDSHDPPMSPLARQPKNTVEPDHVTFATQSHAPKDAFLPRLSGDPLRDCGRQK